MSNEQQLLDPSEPVEVTVRHFPDPVFSPGEEPSPPGWYFWETECPEEGCFYFGVSCPTADDLKAICHDYVLDKVAS